MHRRYIIIGDVHGCRTELRELLAACHVTKDDCVVYVGDLLDKGPDGPGVVADVREADENGQPTIVVMGNHEETNLRFFESQDRVEDPDDKNMKNRVKDPTGDYLRNYQGLSAEDRLYLETKPVLTFEVPGTKFRVVHAGLTSTYEFPEGDLRWSKLSRPDQGRAVIPLRVRFVREQEEVVVKTTTTTILRGGKVEVMGEPQVQKTVLKAGKMITLGKEHESHPYWAHIYDGRLGHIFFGHNAWKDDPSPREFSHATGLDLGCVFGGRLAAAVVTPDSKGGSVEYKTVESKAVYCARYKPTKLENGYYRPVA